MRKPEQTTEPSIEEILASIRRIIADEGSPTAPVFDQAAPDLAEAGREQQAHYDPRYDERRYDDRRDHQFEQQQAREPQYREREPQYREPQHQEREPQYREREPQYREREPHAGEPRRREPQLHDYDHEPQHHAPHYDPRGDYRGREQSGSDYDYESGAHADFHGRGDAASDFDTGDDFNRKRNGSARNGFHVVDDRANNNFDPYATHDDFEAKSIRPSNGNDDEILELTEDFMVEEVSSADADLQNANGVLQPDGEAESYEEPDFSLATDSDFDFALETDNALNSSARIDDEAVPAVAAATMAPLSDDAFSAEGLEGVLSNVVAEMQRLSEGKGLSALLESNTLQSQPQPEPEGSLEPMAAPVEKPQPRSQSWQPRARQASATPAQRPVWSARRLDSDGGSASQSASTPQSGQNRERSRSTMGAPEDGSLGAPPSAEAMAWKPTAQAATNPATQSGSASAPTALARDAQLKTTVEEVMPDLPEGDFPPEPGTSASGRPHSKITAEAIAAVRGARKPETATPEETPELPSGADEEVAAPAVATPQKAVSQPQMVAPVKVTAPKAVQAPALAAVATAKAEASPITPPPTSPAPASGPLAAALKSQAEKIAAAPLPAGLEDGVREMLKPLVADWLKDNLPRLVEELLREEVRAAGPLAKRVGKE